MRMRCCLRQSVSHVQEKMFQPGLNQDTEITVDVDLDDVWREVRHDETSEENVDGLVPEMESYALDDIPEVSITLAAAQSTAAVQAATPEDVVMAAINEEDLRAANERFLDALGTTRREAVARARAVHADAGGPSDPFTDVMMARFCSENDWNDEKAHAQIIRTVSWRRDVGADEYRRALLSGRRLVEFERWQIIGKVMPPLPWLGTTIDGAPMQLGGPGGIDIEGLLSHTINEFADFNLLMLEFNYLNIDKLTLARADGTLVRMFVLSNMAGVTFSHLRLMKYARRIAPTADSYYPELVSTVITFNVGAVMITGYNMLKPLLSAKMQRKIQLLGLLENTAFTSPEHIPACYGGRLTQLPTAVRALLGLDRIDDVLQEQLFCAPTKYAGQLHLPPERARALEDARLRGKNR